MFCPNCGTKNDDNDLFCSGCGTSLKEYQEESAQEEVKQSYEQPVYEQPVYEQPVYEQPVYEQPVYEQPVQGQPVQGQPAYQQPVPVKEKKPISKSAKILAAEVILAAALLIGVFTSLNKKFSPETVATNYWKAANDCKWSEAYDYCSFPENEMLDKQMYVNAHADDEKGEKYKSVKAQKVVGAIKNNTKEEVQTYTIECLRAGSAEREYETVQIVKAGKRFLFWNDWKVVPEDAVAKNVEFYFHKGTAIKLNGKEVKGKVEDNDNGWQYMKVPYLFCGSYQLEAEAEGMEDYRSVIEVFTGGCSDSDISLIPSKETKEKLAEQFVGDFEKILESAVSGKDFNEVKQYFSEKAANDKYVKSKYESLVSDFAKNENTKSFTVSNIKVVCDYATPGQISLEVTFDVDGKHLSFWDDGLQDYDDEISKYIDYVKDGDEWKLGEMPMSSYNLLW